MKRHRSRSQAARRNSELRAAATVLLVGCLMLLAGGFGLVVEHETVNHTARDHFCAFTSWLAVSGTFGGVVFTGLGLGFMIFGDER